MPGSCDRTAAGASAAPQRRGFPALVRRVAQLPENRLAAALFVVPVAAAIIARVTLGEAPATAFVLGVSIRQYAPVTDVTVDASGRATGVVVGGTEHIGAGSVVAAGPWSVALCKPLGIDLPIRGPERDPRQLAQVLGAVGADHELLTPRRARQRWPGFRGQKLAEYNGGKILRSAVGQDGQVDPANRARIIDYVTRFLPGLEPEPYAETTCLFTTTPSSDFLIDSAARITLVSPARDTARSSRR